MLCSEVIVSIRKSNDFHLPGRISLCYHRLRMRIMGNLQLYQSIWFMPWEVIAIVRGESKPVKQEIIHHYYLYFENSLLKGSRLCFASQRYISAFKCKLF